MWNGQTRRYNIGGRGVGTAIRSRRPPDAFVADEAIATWRTPPRGASANGSQGVGGGREGAVPVLIIVCRRQEPRSPGGHAVGVSVASAVLLTRRVALGLGVDVGGACLVDLARVLGTAFGDTEVRVCA